MYRQCTTEKTATQQKIFCDTLYKVMHEESYSDISITDLCLQAGLSRNIFYRLFDCKDDVLFALIDEHFYECATATQHKSPRENLLAFYKYWKSKKPFLDILYKNRMESLLFIRSSLYSRQINFRTRNLIENDSEEEALSFYASGFIGILFHWYHSDFSRTVEEMADVTLQLINHPPFL